MWMREYTFTHIVDLSQVAKHTMHPHKCKGKHLRPISMYNLWPHTHSEVTPYLTLVLGLFSEALDQTCSFTPSIPVCVSPQVCPTTSTLTVGGMKENITHTGSHFCHFPPCQMNPTGELSSTFHPCTGGYCTSINWQNIHMCC
ncbi:hypothetical protein O181_054644 [Austropuccinia psidii MF-1]|uniref:Uncharacterized protein n=1 Tax=Austropuccinia psidii MF-1 TaxID=1389203 RepID=A0A9Q3HTV2_9BASI|nr:hypothetical protein [Austropuccinia psidii MF-1]